MITWYVKKLSKLTKVSVRTLHYYDKIGLLKPSGRASNGYRVYSENDLLNLQQIIALKFFGFTLAQIKILLDKEIDTLKLLRAQLELLREEASYLENAQKKLLMTAIQELEAHQHIDWHHIVELIEVYAKSKELKQNQTIQAFLDEQFKDQNHEEASKYQNILQKKLSERKFEREQ
jgi:DNA-binding transcriptional MerR regulator